MDQRAHQSLIDFLSITYSQITTVKSRKAAGKVMQDGTLDLKSESSRWNWGAQGSGLKAQALSKSSSE
jgi:hypothetical protein